MISVSVTAIKACSRGPIYNANCIVVCIDVSTGICGQDLYGFLLNILLETVLQIRNSPFITFSFTCFRGRSETEAFSDSSSICRLLPEFRRYLVFIWKFSFAVFVLG